MEVISGLLQALPNVEIPVLWSLHKATEYLEAGLGPEDPIHRKAHQLRTYVAKAYGI